MRVHVTYVYYNFRTILYLLHIVRGMDLNCSFMYDVVDRF